MDTGPSQQNQGKSKQQTNYSYLKQSQFSFTTHLSTPIDLQVCLCQDNTLLILDQQQVDGNKQFKLKHSCLNGEPIKQLSLGIARQARVKMMTPMHAIIMILGFGEYSLIQWNLQTNSTIKLECGRGWFIQFLLFHQTKLICVIERTNKNSEYIIPTQKLLVKVSYYRFPITSDNQQPFFVSTPEQNQSITYFDKPYKLNNHSGIAWIKQKPNGKYDKEDVDYSTVNILDLRQQHQQICTYKIDPQHKYDKSLYSFFISDIHQLNFGKLYIKFNIFGSLRKFKQTQQPKTQQRYNQIISDEKVIDLIWSYKNNQFNILKFAASKIFQKDHVIQFTSGLRPIKNFIYQEQLKSQFMEEQRSWYPNVFRQVDIYYVDEVGEQVICVEQPRSDKATTYYGPRSFYPDYDNGIFLEYEINNDETVFQNSMKRIEGRICTVKTKLNNPSLVFAYIMVQILSEIDQDLLCGILDLIMQSNQLKAVQASIFTTPPRLKTIKPYFQ